MKLPEPYTDCVIKHKDLEYGYRLARLNHTKTLWQLYSANKTCRYDYAWKVEDVIAFKPIDYNF